VEESVRSDVEDLGRYIQPTPLCDFEDPILTGIATRLTESMLGERDKAVQIFNHVRDQILFGGYCHHHKASETYVSGVGGSLAKANVFAALCRAVLIPTRLHCVFVKKRVFKHLSADFVYRRMPQEVAYGWPECSLDGQWRACDLTLDEGMYKAALRWGYLTRDEFPTIDWNGATDLIWIENWITSDIGSLDSLDQLVRRMRSPEGRRGMLPRVGSTCLGSALCGSANRMLRGLWDSSHPDTRALIPMRSGREPWPLRDEE
jgi:hypothetical protein